MARLYGRELDAEELARIKAQVESFDTIEVIDDEMRALVETEWPELAKKLPPRPSNVD